MATNLSGYPYEEKRYKFQDFECRLPEGSILFDGKFTEEQLIEQGFTPNTIVIKCVTPSKVAYFVTLEALKVRLYELTKKFTLKHIHHYYQQFRGDALDLANDFYIEFLTPKARATALAKGARKENLIDKYSSGVTSFEYYVKNAVIRKLIDCSRKDRNPVCSIDRLQEEYGDLITDTFNLTIEQSHSGLSDFIDPSVDERVFTEDEVEFYRSKYEQLSENVRQSFVREYYKVRNVFANGYRQLFDTIIESVPSAVIIKSAPRPQVPQPYHEVTFDEMGEAFLKVLSAIA